MKSLKEYYLKQARDSLTSLKNLVECLDQGDIEIQQVRSAAKHAEQVASDLNRLSGIVESENT